MELDSYIKTFEKEYERDHKSELHVFDSIKAFNADNLIIEEYPLERNMFYYSKDVIFLYEEDDFIGWVVEEHSIKQLYLSYQTLDNNFAVAPEKSFFEVNPDNSYYIDIQIRQNETISITPVLIHYSKGKKRKQTNINEVNQAINFDKSDDKCRLTFKIRGHGNFSIENIKVIKMKQGEY
ncbi:hypothetical protein [Salinicoccus albus]|uniref:hypothetical protein n=1 Tax=Salinicoccus albus TaxID=418756 RepID=UPI00037DD50A|nr:hypothetical protein [Salinicoccus albus]